MNNISDKEAMLHERFRDFTLRHVPADYLETKRGWFWKDICLPNTSMWEAWEAYQAAYAACLSEFERVPVREIDDIKFTIVNLLGVAKHPLYTSKNG